MCAEKYINIRSREANRNVHKKNKKVFLHNKSFHSNELTNFTLAKQNGWLRDVLVMLLNKPDTFNWQNFDPKLAEHRKYK